MTNRTISKDGKLVTGLPREYFVDKEVYERESELIFGKSWLCVAHVDQLDPASILPLDVGCYSILIVRDEDGSVRAFHNVCRHRGTRLCNALCESVQSIQCSYHAWTYDLKGALVGAPNMLDQAEFDRDEFGLLPVALEVWNGFVFVCLDDQANGFEEFIQPLAMRMENRDLSDIKLAAMRSYKVNANWKLIFQNYSECYHCPTVHPTLNQLTPFRSASNDLEQGAILGGPMVLEDEHETVSTNGKYVAKPFDLDDENRRRVYYYTVFPSLGFSPHPDYLMAHLLRRIDCSTSEVQCLFFTRGGEAEGIERAVEMWDKVNREDWNVCELTQKGAESPAFTPGPYSSLESMLAEFDRHYLESMQANV